MSYSMEQFLALNESSAFVVTQHGRKRLAERGIRIQDIRDAIASGEIIEDYPDDYPFPSCLILGKSGEKSIHICASIDGGMIYLITAYIPSPEKWESDNRTRKDGQP